MTTAADHLSGWFRRKPRPAESETEAGATASATTGGGSEHEPVVVWEAANVMEAHVVKGRLESEGIPAIIRGEALSTIYGLTAGGLARTEVLVPAPLADQALDILFPPEEEAGEAEATDDSPAA